MLSSLTSLGHEHDLDVLRAEVEQERARANILMHERDDKALENRSLESTNRMLLQELEEGRPKEPAAAEGPDGASPSSSDPLPSEDPEQLAKGRSPRPASGTPSSSGKAVARQPGVPVPVSERGPWRLGVKSADKSR